MCIKFQFLNIICIKIPVVVDLSVGKNLQDHIITGMDMITLEKPLGLSFKDIISPINIYKYFSRGMGKIKIKINGNIKYFKKCIK